MLGVRIDTLEKPEALVRVHDFLVAPGQKKIFTPNPEMLVKATTDESFRVVLNRGDLNLCDGFGIRLLSLFRIQRISGIDFMLDICALAENEGKSIFLLGGGNDMVAKETERALKQLYPKLIIAGADGGPTVEENGERVVVSENEQAALVNLINEAKPDILFVAFGMGKQEKWIDSYLPNVPTVKIAMGVGGAFDFISGRVGRAPLLLRKIGLEWLWRLMRQPWRMVRIFNATVRFIYLVVFHKV